MNPERLANHGQLQVAIIDSQPNADNPKRVILGPLVEISEHCAGSASEIECRQVAAKDPKKE